MTIDAPPPNGFLYAYIDTGIPGANTLGTPAPLGGITPLNIVTLGATEGYKVFTDWLADWDDHLFTDPSIINPTGTIEFSTTTGKVSFNASDDVLLAQDRSPILWGFNKEPGDSFGEVTTSNVVSDIIPRGAVWLVGASIKEIEIRRELVLDAVRLRRSYGYSWGGARMFRWVLTMHRDALDAFDAGFVCSGKVRLQMTAGASAMASGVSGGYLDGYVVGVENVKPMGPTHDFYQATMLVTADA